MGLRARLDHLDGLRGFAALAVVFQHAAQTAANSGAGLFDPLLQTINLGRFGVVLFFLISGFVIPFSFSGERPLRQFVRSRFFRIYPAYWLAVMLLAAILIGRGFLLDPALIAANLTLLHSLMGYPSVFPGSWTLLYELAFYGLCVVLHGCGLLGNARVIGVLALLLLVNSASPFVFHLLGWAAVPGNEVSFFFAIFLLGLLLRSAIEDGDVAARQWASVLAPLAMVTGAFLSGVTLPVPDNANRYLAPLPLAMGMVLPVGVFLALLLRKPATHPWLIYLGAISYSVYLFQDAAQLVLPALVPAGRHPVAYVLAVLVTTIALASVTYRFLERPMIAFGRRAALPLRSSSQAA